MAFDEKFWVAAAFVLFMVLLGKTLWKFLTGSLDGRSAKIADELAEARRLREEAEAVLASYRRKESEALAEAEGIIAKAKEDAVALAVRAEAELKDALNSRMKLAMDKIAQEEARAIQDVQHRVIDISINAAEQLLRDQMAQESGDEQIKRAIKEVSSKLH